MVDVEQRTLCAFKQQVFTALVRFVQFARYVGNHGFQDFGLFHRLRVNRFKRQGFGIEVRGQNVVVQIQHVAQFGGEAFGVFQILHAQGTAGDFVFVRRADAASGRTDFGVTAFFAGGFTGYVERCMERQNQRASFAHAQAGTHFYAGFFQPRNFFKQLGNGKHHTVADVAFHARTHDAAGNQMQGGFHAVNHQRMPRVMTTLETHHALGGFGQPIHELAFTFIAPLGSDDDDITSFVCCIH